MKKILVRFDRRLLAQKMNELLPVSIDVEPMLAAGLRDAVSKTGSLTRAVLAYQSFLAVGISQQLSCRIAIGIEYFHTASLILDDLPCMDDATQRRGVACTHTTYGTATAILIALSLINRAYTLIWTALARCNPKRLPQCEQLIDRCLGVDGILNGQALDLSFGSHAGGVSEVSRIAVLKTGTLFEMCIVLPALCSGSNKEVLLARRLANVLAVLYQHLDDCSDIYATTVEKTPMRDIALCRPNVVMAIGTSQAQQRVARLTNVARRLCCRLERENGNWTFLRQIVDRCVEKADEIKQAVSPTAAPNNQRSSMIGEGVRA